MGLGWSMKQCVVANACEITHVLVEFSSKLQCVVWNGRNGFPDNPDCHVAIFRGRREGDELRVGAPKAAQHRTEWSIRDGRSVLYEFPSHLFPETSEPLLVWRKCHFRSAARIWSRCAWLPSQRWVMNDGHNPPGLKVPLSGASVLFPPCSELPSNWHFLAVGTLPCRCESGFRLCSLCFFVSIHSFSHCLVWPHHGQGTTSGPEEHTQRRAR